MKMLRGMLIGSCALLMALLLGPGRAEAQTPVVLTNPDLKLMLDGYVHAIARQPDGGVVFAGAFSLVNGEPRSNIARLRPDGTLDPAWNPGADERVRALAVDAEGSVFVGGEFFFIGGMARTFIAKLSGTGSGATDAAWNPGSNGHVHELAVDGAAVFAAGTFTAIGGQPRSRLAKLSAGGAGNAAPDWNPSVDGRIRALAVDGSGNLFAGGDFANIGGLARSRIAKLSAGATALVDPDWNPSANGITVTALAIDGTETLYAGGRFSSIGGQVLRNIAKLSTSGSGAADVQWNPSPDNLVSSLGVDGSGAVYAGGLFYEIGGTQHAYLAKLDGSGSGAVDTAWNPSPDGPIDVLTVGLEGAVHASGGFTHIGDEVRLAMVALTPAGTVGLPVDAGRPGYVFAVAAQPGGGSIVAGAFLKADGHTRQHLLRLLPNGTLDPLWEPAVNGEVRALATDSNGDVYVGGLFSSVDGHHRSSIARLDGGGTGAVDPVWDPDASNSVHTLAVDGQGAVFAGGMFMEIGGRARNFIAKLAGSGSGEADADWNPSADSFVNVVLADGNGSIYAGGVFQNIGGQPRAYIAKLAADGSGAADPAWNPSADQEVKTLALGIPDSVYAGGRFSQIGGESRSSLAKLSASGAGVADATWNPAPDGEVVSLALHGDDAIFAAGTFHVIGGLPVGGVARLSTSDIGAVDPNLSFALVTVFALSIDSVDTLIAGGDFTLFGDSPRQSLARFPLGASYTLTYSSAAHGSVTGVTSQTVAQGLDGTAVTAVANSGYRFDQWSDGAIVNPRVDAGVAADVLVEALFLQEVFAVTATANGNGSIAPPTQSVGAGDTADFTVQANPGHRLVDVTGDTCVPVDGGSGNWHALDITAACAVSASFNQDPVAEDGTLQVTEDSSAIAGVLVGHDDDPLEFEIVAEAGRGTVVLLDPGTGSYTYTPTSDDNGSDEFTFRVSGGGIASNVAKVSVTIGAVNDPPTLVMASLAPHSAETSGMQTRVAFASVEVGPVDEQATQAVDEFLIDDIEDVAGVVVPGSVAIAVDGTLSYALTGIGGSASVAIRVRDTGPAGGGNMNTSAPASFSIHVGKAADLRVTKDNGRPALRSGETAVYLVEVFNDGPNAVTGVRILDVLPAELLDGEWSCDAGLSIAGCPTPASDEGNLDVVVDLDVGESVCFEVRARVGSSAGTIVSNTATAVLPADVKAVNPGNDSASDQDPVLPDAVFVDGFENVLEIGP